uniref:Uncharacterized protein n=1 Tax=Tetraselmis sp. GSL018 TaxID=582737 RepID=A0A061SI92_9CHLO
MKMDARRPVNKALDKAMAVTGDDQATPKPGRLRPLLGSAWPSFLPPSFGSRTHHPAELQLPKIVSPKGKNRNQSPTTTCKLASGNFPIIDFLELASTHVSKPRLRAT